MIGFHSLAKFFHCIARSVLLCELSELHFTHAAQGRSRLYTEDCVFYAPRGVYVTATRLIAWWVRSRLLTLTSDISQLPRRRNWAVPGGFNG
jgi:hypothetical protein